MAFMKKFTCAVLCLLFWSNIHAQVNNAYLADLQKLYETLQGTPSFKAQIKGQKLTEYQALYEQLKKAEVGHVSDPRHYLSLVQLFFPIRDNHLGFIQIDQLPHPDVYPSFKGNLDSLKAELAKKPLEQVEGLYQYGGVYSIGFFKSADQEYLGVIFDSKEPHWKNGEIAARLYETEPNTLRAVYAHPKSKNLIWYPIEKYKNYSLLNSSFYFSYTDGVYSKVNRDQDHVNIPKQAPPFRFKSISTNVQYIQVKHFSADRAKFQQSQAFVDSIKNHLSAPNLVLDLRNNEGGSTKAANLYLNLLKPYSKANNIYVLINNGTISQGEIFTLQLMKWKNVQVLGQTSRGTLAYGSNYGKWEKLPSGAFSVYLTDMGGSVERLAHENIGVQPAVVFSGERDWIEQVLEVIGVK
jgi:Peptidase family S41